MVVRTGRVGGGVPVAGVVSATRRMAERRERTVKYVSSGAVSFVGVDETWRKRVKEFWRRVRDSTR